MVSMTSKMFCSRSSVQPYVSSSLSVDRCLVLLLPFDGVLGSSGSGGGLEDRACAPAWWVNIPPFKAGDIAGLSFRGGFIRRYLPAVDATAGGCSPGGVIGFVGEGELRCNCRTCGAIEELKLLLLLSRACDANGSNSVAGLLFGAGKTSSNSRLLGMALGAERTAGAGRAISPV